jgi:GDPmannose 4,6-dehydratase
MTYRQVALITGITGQDGSYLAELLLEKKYEVHGIVRRSSSPSNGRIAHLVNRIQLHPADLLDQASLMRVLYSVRPKEVYNLAAQSFVGVSWDQPILTGEITGLGAVRMLEAVRSIDRNIRFYQAGTSEMYGGIGVPSCSEATTFHPRSPYGAAKAYAHWSTVGYRESHKMFAVNGILFNHESPRRGLEFVTRKITHGVARIKEGLASELVLGNLNTRRDWGYARDYVRAMWLMLQQDTPSDYVIATGETHSVGEFMEAAFKCAGLNWREYLKVDGNLFRPADIETLKGDASKAEKELGWKPDVQFQELVELMVQNDLRKVREA